MEENLPEIQAKKSRTIKEYISISMKGMIVVLLIFTIYFLGMVSFQFMQEEVWKACGAQWNLTSFNPATGIMKIEKNNPESFNIFENLTNLTINSSVR